MGTTVPIPQPSSGHDTAALAERLEQVEAQLATLQDLFRTLGLAAPPPRPVLHVVRGGAA